MKTSQDDLNISGAGPTSFLSSTTSHDDSTSSSNGSLPLAQINIRPQSRQKTLKLNPPALSLSATFSSLQPYNDVQPSFSSATSDPQLVIISRYATVGLIECFMACDSNFYYDKSLNPRRVLTKPSRPIHNNGYDNEKWDYILYVNDVIGNEEGRKYVILDLLGQGTFGQVVKCMNLKTRELCAVKVIKNQPAYFNQSMMEVTVLEMLNQKYDREDRRHIVRMRDTFIFRQHLCIVVELLSLNLYELIKQNGYRGFSLGLCRVFLAQTLDALTVLKEARIIHCDLKPENILLKSLEAPIIKVIDYGSACHEHQTVYTYIQSRFYRSPEIILGLPYTSSIDMWSVGCIAAELFLGLPIFPGCSNYDQISRVVECLGLPPHHMLEMGKDTLTYFDKFPNQPTGRTFALKTRERYSFETGRSEPVPKKYFSCTTFPQILLNYPMRSSSGKELNPPDRDQEMANRRCFTDFVGGLLNLNPLERWNPYQAMQHPFITGKPFLGPFQPTLQPLLATVSVANPAVDQRPRGKGPVLVGPGATTTAAATVSAMSASAGNQARSRPRSNTLSTLTFQDVPPQLQRLAAVSKAQGQAPPAPQTSSRVIPEEANSAEGLGLFGEPRRSSIVTTANITKQPGSWAATAAAHNLTPTQGSSNQNNPQLQAHQRLSAYMTNRRVSNPAGMQPYGEAAIGIQGGLQPQGEAGNSPAGHQFFPMGPSSLPASTGFFYYNNVAPQGPGGNGSGANGTIAAASPASRRNSSSSSASNGSRASSHLSLESSSSEDFIGATATGNVASRRASMSFSSGAMHRIDEDVPMSHADGDTDADVGDDDSILIVNSSGSSSADPSGLSLDEDFMDDGNTKRQRKRT